MSTMEEKLFGLAEAKTTKTNRLQEKVLIESITDKDSITPVGGTQEDRVELFDAYEVYHDDPLSKEYFASPQGIAKMERQRYKLAGELNVPYEQVTNEDVYEAGARQTLDGLYELTRTADMPATTTHGPLDYYRTNKLELGSKEAPLNIESIRSTTGQEGNMGRVMADYTNPNTGVSLAQSNMGEENNTNFGARYEKGRYIPATHMQLVKDMRGKDIMYDIASKYGSTDFTPEPDNNMARGFASHSMMLAGKVGELVGEGIQSIGEITDQEQIADIGNRVQQGWRKFDKAGMVDEISGYDRTSLNEYQDNLVEQWKSGDYVGALINAVADKHAIQSIVNSSPEMLALAVSLGSMAVVNANHHLNQAEENKGDLLTTQEKIEATAISVFSTSIDRFGDKLALNGMNPVKQALRSMVNNLGKLEKNALVKTFGKDILTIGSAPLRLLGAAGVEGVTETLQTAGEQLATDIDTLARVKEDGYDGFTQDEIDEQIGGGLMGFGAGGIMATPKVVSDTLKKEPTEVDRQVEQITKEAKQEEALILDEVINKADNIEESADIVTSFNELVQLEGELVNEKGREKELSKVKQKKKELADRLSQIMEPSDLPDIGSKQEAIDNLGEIIENTSDINNEQFNKNIKIMADKAGITDKQVQEMKNIAQVDKEAKTSDKGYITMGRALRKLQKAPKLNSDKIEKIQSKLENFLATQESKTAKWTKFLSTAEAKYRDGTLVEGKPYRKKLEGYTGQIATVYYKDIKNKLENNIDTGAYSFYGKMQENITGIQHELNVSGIKIEPKKETSVVTKPNTSRSQVAKINNAFVADPTSLDITKLDTEVVGQLKAFAMRGKNSKTKGTKEKADKLMSAIMAQEKVKVTKELKTKVGVVEKLEKATNKEGKLTNKLIRKKDKLNKLWDKMVTNNDTMHSFLKAKARASAELKSKQTQLQAINERLERLYAELELATNDSTIAKAVNEVMKFATRSVMILTKFIDLASKQKTTTQQEIKELKELIKEYKISIKEIRQEAKDKQLEAKGEVITIQNKLNKQSEKVKELTKEIKGTTQIESILSNSNTIGSKPVGTKDLIEQDIDISKILEPRKESATLLSSLPIEAMTPAVKAAANKATKLLNKVVGEYLDEGKEKYMTRTGPARGLLFNNDGSINETVALAIHMAMEEYMAYLSSGLKNKNISDIARMLGKDSDSQVDRAAFNFFKDKGMYKKNMADNIGKSTLKNLGLTYNKNIDEQVYHKLLADIGQIGTLMSIKAGYTTYSEFSVDKIAEFTKDDNFKSTHQDTTVGFIKAKDSFKPEKSVAYYEGLENVLGIESENRKGPHLKPVTKKNEKVRKNKLTEVPEESIQVLNKLRNFKHSKITTSINYIRDNKELVKDYMGYTSKESLDTMTQSSRESAIAKNQELDKSVDELLKFDEQGISEVYFDWFFSKNGRYMMDSNTLNPQSDKLHRFTIVPSSHIVEVDMSKHEEEFNYAIAQAFGFAVDKKHTKKITEFANKVKEMDPDKLLKLLKNKKAMHKAGIEVEEIGHYLQGVEAVRSYQARVDGKFTTNLSAEFDGVTSGFGIKLAQMPYKRLEDNGWMAKVGILLNNEGISMNDVLDPENGSFLDSYQTLASRIKKNKKMNKSADRVFNEGSMWKEYSELLPEAEQLEEQTNISSDLRTLFKDPFMTFNYAAGMKSIKASLSYNINLKMLDRIVAGDKATSKLSKKLNKAVGGDLITKLKTEDIDFIKTNLSYNVYNKMTGEFMFTKKNAMLGDYLNQMNQETYGTLVQEIMESEFSEFMEANKIINDTFKSIFAEYKKDYDKEISKLSIVTVDSKLEIIKSLRSKFPIIKGPMSKGYEDGIAIFSEKLQDSSLDRFKHAQTAVKPDVTGKGSTPKQKSGQHGTLKIQSMIREFEAAMSAGAVIPIHFIDGTAIGRTILKSKGLQSIHDAIIPPLTNAKQEVQNYNEEWYKVNKEYSITEQLLVTAKRAGVKDLDALIELNDGIQEARKEFYKRDMTIVQMAGLQGSGFTTKKVKKSKKIGDEVITDLGSDAKASTAKQKKVKKIADTVHKSTESMKELAQELNQMDNSTVSKEEESYLLGMLDKVNPDFLNEMNVYLNSKAKETSGVLKGGKTLYLNIDRRKKSKGANIPGMRMYVHEILHAITGYAIRSRNPEAFKIVRKIEQLRKVAASNMTWEDLMPDSYVDKKLEEKKARAMYDYMFHNKTGLDEFISHGLTEPKVMEKLKALKVFPEKEVHKTILDAIAHYLNILLDLVMGRFSIKDSKSTSYEQLMELTFELAEYNNKAIKEVKDNTSLVDKVYGQLQKGDAIVKDKMEQLGDKLSDVEITPPPLNGTKWEYAKWLSKYLGQLTTRDDMKPYLSLVLSSMGMKPEGFVQNVLRDIRTPDELERLIEQLGLDSDTIDQTRENIATAARDDILSAFSTIPTKVEQEVMTVIGLDTDLSSIYASYGQKKIKSILESPTELIKQIEQVKKELKVLNKSDYKWNESQAHGLGKYLATHKAHIAQNLNASNIASRVLTNDLQDADPKVVKKIDELATLQGLRYSAEDTRASFADLIDREALGIRNLMGLHTGFKKEADAKLFKTKALQIKGYTKEIFDDSVSVEIKPVSHRGDLKADGYELIEILEKDPSDTSKERMAIYRSKMFATQSYNRAATRMTDLARRGTTLTDIRFAGDEVLAKKQAQRDRVKLDKLRADAIKEMRYGTFVDDGNTSHLVPVLNDAGDVVDYRYMMGKERKKELLEQDNKAPKVLSRMLASTFDKLDTTEQNEAVLDTILADMEDNYIEGSTIGKNNMQYIKIEADSPYKKVQEIYRLLPSNMKKAINDSNDGYIAVRRDMLHNYFGFRNFSVMDTWLGGITPREIKTGIRIAEKIWQEIVSISKIDIILRTPMVFIGNVVSNIMYSISKGRNLFKVAKMQLDSVRYLRDYLNTHQELESLKIAKQGGNQQRKDIKRISDLEAQLERNPLKGLMDKGMYQAIIEDVSTQDFESSNKVSQWVENNSGAVPDFIKDGAHWMFISEKTSLFKFMAQATQYSDFVARATEYQLLIAEGVTDEVASQTILDAFINYNKPATDIEQYLNDMGLVMFTKYAKRVQRAIHQGITDHPVNFLLSILGQEFLLGDIDDITDQGIFSKNWSNIFYNAFDTFMRAITPSMGELAFAIAK